MSLDVDHPTRTIYVLIRYDKLGNSKLLVSSDNEDICKDTRSDDKIRTKKKYRYQIRTVPYFKYW